MSEMTKEEIEIETEIMEAIKVTWETDEPIRRGDEILIRYRAYCRCGELAVTNGLSPKEARDWALTDDWCGACESDDPSRIEVKVDVRKVRP